MGHRVLIIDDQKNVLLALKVILKQAGYQIETASGMSTAKMALADHNFDIIITDIFMEDGDGLELLDYVRDLEKSKKKKTHIVAMSGGHRHVYSDMALRSVRDEADAFLKKPFKKDDIVGLIETLMNPPKAEIKNPPKAAQPVHKVGQDDSYSKLLNDDYVLDKSAVEEIDVNIIEDLGPIDLAFS